MKKRFLTLGAILVVLMFVASPAMSATLTATSTLNSTTVTWSAMSNYQPTSQTSIALSNDTPDSATSTKSNSSQYLDTDNTIPNPSYQVNPLSDAQSIDGVAGTASSTAYYNYAGAKAAAVSLTFDDEYNGISTGEVKGGYVGYFNSASFRGGVANGTPENGNGGKFSVSATVTAASTGAMPVAGSDSVVGLIVDAYYLSSAYAWVDVPLTSMTITDDTDAVCTVVERQYGTQILGPAGDQVDPFPAMAYYFEYNIAELIAAGGSANLNVAFDFFYDGTHTLGTADGVRIAAVPMARATVPIPGAIWLLGSGLIGLLGFRKNMKK